MKLGFIGAGDFAQAVAKRALKAAHKVLVSNSRGAESVREMALRLGAGARAATIEEAAEMGLRSATNEASSRESFTASLTAAKSPGRLRCKA
jgi:3-hydroxyisobutyrate dehydrogenase-like beta-hydroxyacid dehydrogenase